MQQICQEFQSGEDHKRVCPVRHELSSVYRRVEQIAREMFGCFSEREVGVQMWLALAGANLDCNCVEWGLGHQSIETTQTYLGIELVDCPKDRLTMNTSCRGVACYALDPSTLKVSLGQATRSDAAADHLGPSVQV
jgi:hypothetical protein